MGAGQRVAGEEAHDGGAMAGVTGDPRNGVLAHETKNGKHGNGQELTASPVEAFSVFGTGSRG